MDTQFWAFLIQNAFSYEDPQRFLTEYGFLLAIDLPWTEACSVSNRIWLTAHIPVKDLVFISGHTIQSFALRFSVPERTIFRWCSLHGHRDRCPRYIRIMLGHETGLLPELLQKPI